MIKHPHPGDFIKVLQAKEKSKDEKYKLMSKAEWMKSIKEPPKKIEWLEDEVLYNNVAALQEAKYKKMQEHKKQLEQTMFYGVNHDHSAAAIGSSNYWWIATNDPQKWGAHSHYPAQTVSATWSNYNYTQVYPTNGWGQGSPPMTREKAIALNDGTT